MIMISWKSMWKKWILFFNQNHCLLWIQVLTLKNKERLTTSRIFILLKIKRSILHSKSFHFLNHLTSLRRKIITESKNTRSFSKIMLFDRFTKQIKVKFSQSFMINETSSKTSFMNANEEFESEILLQFETRFISHDQLIEEVKEIYAELIMMKVMCINVNQKQFMKVQEKNSSRQTNLSNEQWQILITLHKKLLHEHHDFLLISQHSSVNSTLSKLAAKYSMSARMWNHEIHAFLKILRHRFSESLDHMLTFIYIAYSMMILLYETVSTFEDIWIECLKDLERYRMTIEDNHENRNIWSDVASFWDSKMFDIISTETFSNNVSIDFSLTFESQSDILAVKLKELLDTKIHESVNWNQKKETLLRTEWTERRNEIENCESASHISRNQITRRTLKCLTC